jgi:hypothetical protein
MASPITGPAGNHEYLLWLQPQQALNPDQLVTTEAIADLVDQTLSTRT